MNVIESARRLHRRRVLDELRVLIPEANRAQRKLREDREAFKAQYGYDPIRGK